MEVFPLSKGKRRFLTSLLHARGGVSSMQSLSAKLLTSSPRSWRCFLKFAFPPCFVGVFSTLVEVFLNLCACIAHHWRLLHARGGVSLIDNPPTPSGTSSPRSWRCFPISNHVRYCQFVFSTLVEVFLECGSLSDYEFCLLHARGGVSKLHTS